MSPQATAKRAYGEQEVLLRVTDAGSIHGIEPAVRLRKLFGQRVKSSHVQLDRSAEVDPLFLEHGFVDQDGFVADEIGDAV